MGNKKSQGKCTFPLGQKKHSAVPPNLTPTRPLISHTSICASLITDEAPVGYYSRAFVPPSAGHSANTFIPHSQQRRLSVNRVGRVLFCFNGLAHYSTTVKECQGVVKNRQEYARRPGRQGGLAESSANLVTGRNARWRGQSGRRQPRFWPCPLRKRGQAACAQSRASVRRGSRAPS